MPTLLQHLNLTHSFMLSRYGVPLAQNTAKPMLNINWKMTSFWNKREGREDVNYITLSEIYDRVHPALIMCVHLQHVDKHGFPCHGYINPTLAHKWWHHDMHLLESIRHWVGSLLFVRISPTNIHNKHYHYVCWTTNVGSLHTIKRMLSS